MTRCRCGTHRDRHGLQRTHTPYQANPSPTPTGLVRAQHEHSRIAHFSAAFTQPRAPPEQEGHVAELLAEIHPQLQRLQRLAIRAEAQIGTA
jgi:hypothetical protein